MPAAEAPTAAIQRSIDPARIDVGPLRRGDGVVSAWRNAAAPDAPTRGLGRTCASECGGPARQPGRHCPAPRTQVGRWPGRHRGAAGRRGPGGRQPMSSPPRLPGPPVPAGDPGDTEASALLPARDDDAPLRVARPAKSGYRPIGRPPAAAESASISSTSRRASSRLRGWRGPCSNGAHALYPASVRSVAVSNDHRSTARSAASSLATRALSASMVSDIQSSRVGNGSLAGRPSRPASAPHQQECCRLRRAGRPLATATGQMNAVRTRTGPGAASPAPLRQSGVGLRR